MSRHRVLRLDAFVHHCSRSRITGRLRFSTSLTSCSSSSPAPKDVEHNAASENADAAKDALLTSLMFRDGLNPALQDVPIERNGTDGTDGALRPPPPQDISKTTAQELKKIPESSSSGKATAKARATKRAAAKRKADKAKKAKTTKKLKEKQIAKSKSTATIRKVKTQTPKDSLLAKLAGLGNKALDLIKDAQKALTGAKESESDDAAELENTSESVDTTETEGKSNKPKKSAIEKASKQIGLDKSKKENKHSEKSTIKKEYKRVLSSDNEAIQTRTLDADLLQMEPIDSDHPPVKTLCYNLDRVLFKQGVYNLQDPRTGVYNFDQYLQNIMPTDEFDFDSLGAFITSSKDQALQEIAKANQKSYVGSTSSTTSVLVHFHFLLSNFRPLNLARISSGFPSPLQTFSSFTRIPAAIYLRYKDGVYATDADKEYDRGTILSQLGHSLEKLLLLPKEQYEQYRLSNPEKVPEEMKNTPEAYHYGTLGNFVFRSQLDGHHDWLPGTGIFDIKTRACVTIRMNQENYREMSGYQIKSLYGEWESYEREYLDMLRTTMLKYSLQVRMGRMDGIFVAFHNTEEIFGFQYIPLSEMDLAIHGQENLALGDQEFKLSMQMFSDILDMVTKEHPKQSIRFHFETRPSVDKGPKMYIFAEPMDEEVMDTTQANESVIGMQEFCEELADQDIANQETSSMQNNMSSEKDNPDSMISPIETEQNVERNSSGSMDVPESPNLPVKETERSDDANDFGNTTHELCKDNSLEEAASLDQVRRNEADETESLPLSADAKNGDATDGASANPVNKLSSAQDDRSEPSAHDQSQPEAFNPAIPNPASEVNGHSERVQTENSAEAAISAGADMATDKLLDDDNQGEPKSQRTKTRDYGMAARYPEAASIFFPDDASADAIYPLADSLNLYTGIAGYLGKSVYKTSISALREELLQQAEKSEDSLDSFAAKLQIGVESFWEHPTVQKGIDVMLNKNNASMGPQSRQSMPMFSDVMKASSMAKNKGFNSQSTEDKIKGLKEMGLNTPDNLKWLYFDALLLNQSAKMVSRDHILSRRHLAINDIELRTKMAVLGRPNLYGRLPEVSASTPTSTVLGFRLEVAHHIDGKPVTDVGGINYLSEWPLLQKQYRDKGHPTAPPVNKSWSVKYSITRFSPEQARRKYAECKERRRRKFESLNDAADGFRSQYLNTMAKWSETGRRGKEEAEKKFEGSSIKQFTN